MDPVDPRRAILVTTYNVNTRHMRLLTFLLAAVAVAAPRDVRVSIRRTPVEVYDFREATLTVERPDAANPFTGVSVQARLTTRSGKTLEVEGFCDDDGGATFRVRFPAVEPGLLGRRVGHAARGRRRRLGLRTLCSCHKITSPIVAHARRK